MKMSQFDMDRIAKLNKDQPINIDETNMLKMVGAELQDEVAYASQRRESGLT